MLTTGYNGGSGSDPTPVSDGEKTRRMTDYSALRYAGKE
ncbi:hypothetical protein KVMX100_120394 [Klebsiella variicola]|nr:hypothetical protein KVMX100_120394 [Klebsiella variicola]